MRILKVKLIYALITLWLIVACGNGKIKGNLDYPESIEQIETVILSRPDKESNEKFAQQRVLKTKEIQELLDILKESKAVGPSKFSPDYFIVFTTKEGINTRLKVNRNIIKGYENDFSYEIYVPSFLSNF